jgi:WXG100 family type VII secretion target
MSAVFLSGLDYGSQGNASDCHIGQSERSNKMRKIIVEPELLDACAVRMDQENQDYQRAFTQLFESVNEVKGSWSGKDNAVFSAQIGKFEGDFRQMSILCTQYAEFLRNSARAYRQTQDELTSQAAHLAQ